MVTKAIPPVAAELAGTGAPPCGGTLKLTSHKEEQLPVSLLFSDPVNYEIESTQLSNSLIILNFREASC